jgi:hypothetical protein
LAEAPNGDVLAFSVTKLLGLKIRHPLTSKSKDIHNPRRLLNIFKRLVGRKTIINAGSLFAFEDWVEWWKERKTGAGTSVRAVRERERVREREKERPRHGKSKTSDDSAGPRPHSFFLSFFFLLHF